MSDKVLFPPHGDGDVLRGMTVVPYLEDLHSDTLDEDDTFEEEQIITEYNNHSAQIPDGKFVMATANVCKRNAALLVISKIVLFVKPVDLIIM